ncbi:uncharacterized protein VTP21DRAFT_6632 [Calcarisporiella thermophila]|uniref:uncharacterized protein n=1 Tax=Calcarisporiella thermophila TaxID=911321 RepID=UPI0037437D3D
MIRSILRHRPYQNLHWFIKRSVPVNSFLLVKSVNSTFVAQINTSARVNQNEASPVLRNSVSAENTLPSLNSDSSSLSITWPDSNPKTSEYTYLWLRDNCQCPYCVHPENHQKLHSSSDIPLDIRPKSMRLVNDSEVEIEWSLPLRGQNLSQPHISTYPLQFLKRYASLSNHLSFRSNDVKSVLWDGDMMENKVLWVPYEEFASKDDALHRTLKHLVEYGLVFLKDVPTENEKVGEVAERIGEIRHTFYGRLWDVKSVPGAKNIAYTSLNLGLHMDLMYFAEPPGLQMLHCLKNNTSGGANFFVDSFKAAQILRKEHPEDYRRLTDIPVTFHYLHEDHHMHYERPTIVERSGNIDHVNYSPPFQGPMSDPSVGKEFYAAFQRYSDIISRPELQYELTLQPGECVLFANRRVLHARRAFDAQAGERHLKGVYVDWCAVLDRFRVLRGKQ